MTSEISALTQAVDHRRMRLAVFDVGLRKKTGQWRLTEHVPVQSLIESLAEQESFQLGEHHILPLHEPESPELTDEFVIVDTDGSPALVVFYDPGIREKRAIPLRDFTSSYPAWRLRFFTDAYTPDQPPDFVEEFSRSGMDSAIPTDPVTPQRPDGTGSELFEHAREALVRRRETQRSHRRAEFSATPNEEYIAAYGGIDDLRPAGRTVDDFGQQRVQLAFPTNHPYAGRDSSAIIQAAGIAPGDEILIESQMVADLPVEAELFGVSPDGIECGIYWDSARGGDAEQAFQSDADWPLTIGRLVAASTYAAIESAIDSVERTDHARERYTGQTSLAFGDTNSTELPEDLNTTQQQAFAHAVAAEDIALIEAPPWTGAKRVLGQLIEQSLRADERVLVLTPDEDGIATLLDEQEETVADFPMQIEYENLRQESADAMKSGGSLVITPLADAGAVDDHSFDIAFVDQAARLSVPGGAIPFAKAGRVVLVGDPQQSPTPLQDILPTDALEDSIYEHILAAYGPHCRQRLRCQYRMNEAIAQFPNHYFYDGRLIHGQRNRSWTVDPLDPLSVQDIAGRHRETPTGSVFNDAEVQAVIEEVVSLRDLGVRDRDIGVITPFSAQIGKIRVALNEREADLADRIMVGNVSDFGCESRVAIVFSGVMTGEEPGPHTMATASVALALSRAEKRLALVGDWSAIGTGILDRDSDGPLENLARFLDERGFLA